MKHIKNIKARLDINAGFLVRGLLTCALVSGWVTPSHAQTVVAPAADAICTVGTQNRYAPLDLATGNYQITNLPGNGLIPFGTDGSAQPFRVRATCSDGSVGETALAFPAFEQRVVNAGDIIWGQHTLVPTLLQMTLPSSSITAGGSMQAQVTAIYPNGGAKDVTARATGTGYRSSAAGFIGVTSEGSVYGQPTSTSNAVSSVVPMPPKVVITSENDGVTVSRMVTLVSNRSITGLVRTSDGTAVGAGVPVILYSYAGGGSEVPLRAVTDSTGHYTFAPLPPGYFCFEMLAYTATPVRLGRAPYSCLGGEEQRTVDIDFLATGTVTIRTVDGADAALPGVSVGYSTDLSRLWPSELPRPKAMTDAAGTAVFTDVPVGGITPTSLAKVSSTTPGYTALVAGQTLAFVLKLRDGAASVTSTLTGTVKQAPDGTAVTGAVLVLEDYYGSGSRWTQVAGTGGQYRFDELTPGRAYALSVREAGQVLWSQLVSTSTMGGLQTVDVSLPVRRTLAGVVYEPDGVTPSAGATVNLSSAVLNSWSFDRSVKTDANGRYLMRGVSQLSYRLDVESTTGLVGTATIDLTGSDTLNAVQDVRLAGSGPDTITTIVDLSVTFLDRVPLKAADGLSVTVFNTGCVDGCAVNTSTSAGHWTIDMQLIPGDNSIVVAWRGQKQTVPVKVDQSTNGQTLMRSVNFDPRLRGELTFLGQKSWYTFEANAGDRINVSPAGVAFVSQHAAAYAVRVDLYKGTDGATEVLKSGQGFDPARIPAWNAGDIRGFVAPQTGTYTVVVSPFYPSNPTYLGGYGLDISVNDVAVDITPWSAGDKRLGAAVNGHVLRADGSSAPQQLVQISAGGEVVRMVERVNADATGAYHYDNVPAGQVEVSAMQSGLTLVTASAPIAEGQTLTLDLKLPRVAGRVINASGRPAASARITLDGPGGVQLQTYANELGEYVFASAPVGTGETVTVFHPYTGLSKQAIVDVQSGPVTIVPEFVYGGLHGRILFGSGLPASGVFVEASLPSGYAAYANTDEQGMYFIEGMTPGTGIQVLAYHPRTSDVRVTATADIVDAQETVLPDLSFQVMAKIEGWVRDEKGRGLNGAQVHVAPVGEAHACTNSSDVLGQQGTDTDGHYLIDEVQPGRALTVSAGFGFICQEQNREITTLAQGEARQLPDFVYVGGGETGALTLHLIDTAGKSFVVPDGIDLFHEYECGALYFTVSSLDGMQVKSYLAPDVRYVGIVPGTYSAQLSLSWQCATMTFDSASVTIAPEDDVNLGVSIPMVHGRVLDDKGNAVPYPSVSFVIVSPDGKQSETYFAKTNSQGDYLIIAPSFMTGTYSLRVESGWRGNDLEVPVSLTGNLTSSKPALTLDVMLPPTATVVGTVRTASGAVPSSGGVYVMPEGGRQFQTMRDLSSGAFSISGLPAGKHFIEVVAVDPAYVTQSISTSSTAKGYSYVELPVTVPSGTSFVNMGQSKLAGFGTLEVTARDAAGALLPNQNVYLVQTRFGAPSLSYILTYNKLTGSNGKATFIVPENTYGVASRSAGAYDAVAGGYAEASVKAGQTSTATINVKDGLFLGGDSAYAYRSGSLTSADGVVYTPNINDRLIVSGQSHAYGYYDGPLLSIDGIPAPTTYGVRLLNNSREWLYGPFFKGDGLVVKRRVYVPDSGGFVRVVDTVTNTGTAAVNVRMSQTAPSRIGFDVQLSPQGSGNTSVVYSGGQYQDTIGVAYSDGVSALMPVTTLLAAPYDSYWDGSVLLDWRNSVGAGQTMSIVHFHVLGDNDPVSVQGKIQMLVNKTMPGMFDGLTTQERSDIRNFTISQ